MLLFIVANQELAKQLVEANDKVAKMTAENTGLRSIY
jgi:hypothetical protein